MSWNLSPKVLASALAGLLFAGFSVPVALAQNGSQGKVTVTVRDQSGSVVAGAQLVLEDLSTNDIRKADTEDSGTHTFPNLSLGKYRLTVSKSGFKTQVFTDVSAQAAQTT